MNVLFWSIAALAMQFGSPASPHGSPGAHWVPETPRGLAPCTEPLSPVRDLPSEIGEEVSYDLEAMKIRLGTVAFTVSRAGTFGGLAVTEYRSEVESVGLADALIQLEGEAASIVVDADARPVQAAARYTYQSDGRREMLRFSDLGRLVHSERTEKGKRSVQEPHFKKPVYDLLTSFYVARRLPPRTRGCVVIYAGQEAYTLWLEPEDTEVLDTALGPQKAERYKVRYASNKNKRVHEMRLWIGSDDHRLPLKAEGKSRWSPLAILKHYRAGRLP